MAVRRNTSAANRADKAVGKAAVDRAVDRTADTVADNFAVDRAADRVADTVAGVVGIEVVEPDTEVVVAEQAVERVAARVVVQEQELVQERALEPAMLLLQEFEKLAPNRSYRRSIPEFRESIHTVLIDR